MKEPSQIAAHPHVHVFPEASPLSRTVTRDAASVDVQIYRQVGDPAWTLKVVNQTGTAIIWPEVFASDAVALRVFEADLAKDGIESYRDDAPTTCPLCRMIGNETVAR